VGVWVRSAAIRPVPPEAQLGREALDAVEQWLGDDEPTAAQRLDQIYQALETEQPVLAARLGRTFARGHDEVASALGYFLSLVIFKAFGDGHALARISDTALDSVEQALALDEQLRRDDPVEAVDSDDVVAMEQPHVVAFVHEHIEAALELHGAEADVDAVHAMYRMILVETLALSYAASPEGDPATTGGEIQA
jgi:hypothetical protein